VTDFLNSVLPTQGLYCTVGIRSNAVKQSFQQTIEDVEAVGSGMDSQGVDAYFALATFNDDSGRKVDNAAYLRSFFLDLDCGTGKPYADQAAAAQALSIFISATKLPSPTLVNSGGGLHVYWPLAEDVPASDWVRHAKSLKRLCAQKKLFADPAVTADAARILRIPGTHNFKNATSRPVQIIAVGTPVSLAEFIEPLPAPAMDLSAAKQFGMDETSKDIGGGDYPKCSFKRIAIRSINGNGCAQIKHAIEAADTLEEPLWRGALSVAVRCEDGASAIHTLSKRHPEYSAEATEAKAGETKGPYTCEWYRENNPSLCEGCPQKISSPILLGKFVEEAVVEDDQYIIETPKDETAPALTMSIPAYPFPYFRGANGGVYKKERTPDGEEKDVEIYPYDLYLTERFFDSDQYGNGEGEMVGLNLHMKQDGIRRFYAPVTTLFTKDKMRDLLIKNGVVAYGKHLDAIMAYFASTLRKLQSQYAANKTRSQMGWTPDGLGFVVGELEYTAAGTKLAPPASGTRELADQFKPAGTLEEWSKIANFYDRPGLEPHALALFFGFGSPLLKLIGPKQNVKGALVHLKHNGSGSGKSTAQMVVNSIFGNPDTLLLKQADTSASKMHLLGMMNSIAFTIDEITNEKPEIMSDYAYGFTSGRGRHRMESQSNKLRVNNTSWCNITISSGNSSVVDALQNLKSTADGELRRVLEVAFHKYTGSTKAEIDATFTQLSSNYGVAGPIYIQYVIDNFDHVLDLLAKMQAKVDKALNLDQTDRFYSCILTCAFVGALIAVRLGLIKIDVKRIYQYALGVVQESITSNLASVGNPLTVAQETLGAFINENVNNAMVAAYTPKGGMPERPAVTPKGKLCMRYDPDNRTLAIPVAELRKYFTGRQVDVRDSLARLTEAKYLKHGGKSHPTRIGAGAVGGLSGIAVRCYVFDGDVIGIDETAFPQADDTSTI
jgi:hypothetical protein